MTRLEYIKIKSVLNHVAWFTDFDFQKGVTTIFELKANDEQELNLFVYNDKKGILIYYSIDDKNNLDRIKKVIQMFENNNNTIYYNGYLDLLNELQKQ